MTAPDRYRLHFFSSDSKPLACVAGKDITLGQFRSDVEKLVTQFDGDGDILISCRGRYAFSVALLAAWIGDKAVVLPPNHLDETLQDMRSRFSITFEGDPDWAATLLDTHAEEAHGEWDVTLQANSHAVKLFTSGSTGTPRVITKSIANLLDEAHTLSNTIDWPDGPMVAGVPAQHLYGLTFSLLLPWVTTNAWVDDTPHYPRDILQSLTQTGGKTFISVPAQYQAILEDRTDMRDILCVSAAAPLREAVARQWQQHHGEELLEIYGSTETGVIAYRQQPGSTAWQSFSNVNLTEEQGLLRVTSPFVSDEFAGDYLTADRVTLQDAGQFQLLGRTDTIIKIAGKRVSLTNIETTINTLPGVAEAAVIAVPAKGLVRDIAIWAAVVASGEQPLSPRQLQSALRHKLEGIEVPRRILVVDRLPRTSSGKLPQSALTRLFDEHDATRV